MVLRDISTNVDNTQVKKTINNLEKKKKQICWDEGFIVQVKETSSIRRENGIKM